MARTTAKSCARSAPFPPDAPKRDHAAFADALGFVEHEHAVDMSGSRFASLMREAVLLDRLAKLPPVGLGQSAAIGARCQDG